MKNKNLLNLKPMKAMLVALFFSFTISSVAQTNVFTDVIAKSSDHTSLTAAINAANLATTLQDPNATYTVFAPTNQAFDSLAARLGTDIPGLLNRTDLSDILLYHVLRVQVGSGAVQNGSTATPINDANTLKLSKNGSGDVHVNNAKVNAPDLDADNGVVHSVTEVLLANETVIDVAIDNGFTTLTTAVATTDLTRILTNPFASYTVFAPNNDAFDSLAKKLSTTVSGLLALDNLTDILLYHVLGSEVTAAAVSSGIVETSTNTNTLKVTKTSTDDVFINQAKVILADVSADNGVVHVLDKVVLPNKTVVDVAIDNNFTSLTAAVVQQELLPVLTDPFATFTVFAPTDDAFDTLAVRLETDLNGILELDNLTDVLTYHVLGAEVMAADVTSGVVNAVSNTNTLKVTKTSEGDVFVNQAKVTLADVTAENGVVHVLDAVVLPNETVVDVAIDNNFTSLTAAVVQEELLPSLTDPFASFTVFAPTDDAFNNLAASLNTDLAGVLALDNLSDVLLYHVLGQQVLSTEIEAGTATALSGDVINISTEGGVRINSSNVTTPDVQSTNGVVHIIDKVLLQSTASSTELNIEGLNVYPNPAVSTITVNSPESVIESISILNTQGTEVLNLNSNSNSQRIDISGLGTGMYILEVRSGDRVSRQTMVVTR